MLSPEEMFANDIDDLRRIQENLSTRNLLEASAILRRMLIDSPALLHRVNRKRGFKIKFTVSGAPISKLHDKIGNDPRLLMAFSSASGLTGNQIDVGLDEFLGRKVAIVNGKMFSIADLIKYAANNAGGVHYDPPGKDHKYADLLASSEAVKANDMAVPFYHLADVCRAVLHATDDLYKSLRA